MSTTTSTAAGLILDANLDRLQAEINSAHPTVACVGISAPRGRDIDGNVDESQDQVIATTDGAPLSVEQLDAVIAAHPNASVVLRPIGDGEESGSVTLVPNVDFSIIGWDVPDGSVLMVRLELSIVLSPSGGLARSAIHTLDLSVGRVGAGALPTFAKRGSARDDNAPGLVLTAVNSGNTVLVKVRATATGDYPYLITYRARTVPNP